EISHRFLGKRSIKDAGQTPHGAERRVGQAPFGMAQCGGYSSTLKGATRQVFQHLKRRDAVGLPAP
ncbi:hypothetical protein HAX54_020054, partial [Datura stramonium]|nr:hypothetical protein [Datura stramonium]